MNGRELLEMAAKAAGIRISKHEDFSSTTRLTCIGEDRQYYGWNPLTDDGDALRLAVKLRLTIQLTDCLCCVSVYANQLDGDEADVVIRHSAEFADFETADPHTATRRAIVRAAAEVGKGMK